MSLLGYSNLTPADYGVRKALMPIVQAMPIWPAAGSVRIVDGTILVRLGQEPGVLHRSLIAAQE